MTVLEKVAYLKGLVKGMGVDPESKEGRIYDAFIDVLDDLALSVTDTEDAVAELDEAIGALDEDLGSLEEYVFGDDDECECDNDECECGCGHTHDEDDNEKCGCGDECECDCDCSGETLYQVTCPSCGDEIYLDESMLENGSTKCPNCDELLEFETGEETEEK